MACVPLFIDEEKAAFARVVKDPLFGSYGKLLLTIGAADIASFPFEKFAAAYLLMNATLMTRASRRIVKMICLPDMPPEAAYSFVNALRALFHSEFSGLGNIRVWEELSKENLSRPENMLATVERTVDFLEGSEIAKSASNFNRADIYFGFRDRSPHDLMGGVFSLAPADPFRTTIATVETPAQIVFHEIYKDKYNIYKTGELGRNHLIEFCAPGAEHGIHEMMANIKVVLASEFYCKPEALR